MREFIDRMRSAHPHSRFEIKRTFTDGDYETREPGTRGSAHIDIFRVDDQGKIAEHWDVDEPIPAEIANSHGPIS
jgi:predicted SnoaL-like aldol condensation-catalyzing enzyme